MTKNTKPVKYKVEIGFTPTERKTLEEALKILKEVNKIIDNCYEDKETECVTYSAEAEALLKELDKYTDYLVK